MESYSRRMQEVPQSEILGWVCFDLEPWKRELCCSVTDCMAGMRKGTCHRSLSAEVTLLSSQRPHTGRQETAPGCTGEPGLVPEEHLRRMRRGGRSPAHRGAPVAFVFLYFPSSCFCVATFPCWSTECWWPWPCRELTWLPQALSQTQLSSQALGKPYFF